MEKSKTPRVVALESEDEVQYMVRASSSPEAYAAVCASATADGMVVTTEPEDVAIVWIRAMPCNPKVCPDGHRCHYTPSDTGGSGAFLGAFLWARQMDYGEFEEEYGGDLDGGRHVATIHVSGNRL